MWGLSQLLARRSAMPVMASPLSARSDHSTPKLVLLVGRIRLGERREAVNRGSTLGGSFGKHRHRVLARHAKRRCKLTSFEIGDEAAKEDEFELGLRQKGGQQAHRFNQRSCAPIVQRKLLRCYPGIYRNWLSLLPRRLKPADRTAASRCDWQRTQVRLPGKAARRA